MDIGLEIASEMVVLLSLFALFQVGDVHAQSEPPVSPAVSAALPVPVFAEMR